MSPSFFRISAFLSILSFVIPFLPITPTHAAGRLIKASNPSVYYLASNGRRYVFPNERTYFTWYSDFSQVQQISDSELSSYAIGGNVTYRPGVKLVKITTDPKVYAVDRAGLLRWVQTEEIARTLYGSSWNRLVEDVPDAFFINYIVGAPISQASDFAPSVIRDQVSSIDINLGLSVTPDPTPTPNPTPTTGNPISGNYTGVIRTIRVTNVSALRDATNQARPGDLIKIAPGSYTMNQQWWIEAQGSATHPIYVVADGTRGSVKLQINDDEGVNVGGGAAYLTFEDLEVSRTGNNVFHVQDGAHHITLRNLNLHDAGRDGDVIKLNQAHHITIEGCDLARSGARYDQSENAWQEALDLVDVDDAIIRRNYLHDVGNMAGYVKGGSKRVLIEENVIDMQRAGAGDPLWGIGGWTDAELLQGEQYEAINTTFRNNVIMRGREGALGFFDAQNSLVENNLFVNNDGPILVAKAGNAPRETTSGITLRNNQFVDTRGQMSSVCEHQSHELNGISASNNQYWNNHQAIPTNSNCGYTPSAESGAQIQNPNLILPFPTDYVSAMRWINR